MNTDTLFKCLNFNAIIRLSDRGKGNAEVLSQSEDDFWINQFQISIGLFWQTAPAGAGRWGRDEPLSPPVFYLLYWQPLICNIAKILNRHRRYLDPRSPGTQARPLSVTLSWLLTRSQHFPPLPAHMSNIAPPSHIYQIFLLMKFEDFSPLPLETKFNRRK